MEVRTDGMFEVTLQYDFKCCGTDVDTSLFMWP